MITKTTLLFVNPFFEIQLSWIPKAGSKKQNESQSSRGLCQISDFIRFANGFGLTGVLQGAFG
jgi:hypothetical protein